MKGYNKCSRCRKLFESSNRGKTICDRCIAEFNGRNNPNFKRKLVK